MAWDKLRMSFQMVVQLEMIPSEHVEQWLRMELFYILLDVNRPSADTKISSWA